MVLSPSPRTRRLPPKGFGRRRAAYHTGASAASLLRLDSPIADDATTHQQHSSSLAASSLLQTSPPAGATADPAPTDAEWHSVGQILAGLRTHTLSATPAAAARFSKLTTDTDLWAWKQTSDWQNRHAIQRYLQQSAAGQQRCRPLSAPAKRQSTRRLHSSGGGSSITSSENRRRRPKTAAARRRHRRPTGTSRTPPPLQKIPPQPVPAIEWVARLAEGKVVVRPRRRSRRNRDSVPAIHLTKFMMRTRHVSEVLDPEHVKEELRWKAAEEAQRRKSYRISRKRAASFAKVTHRDKLTLEKVTRLSQRRAAALKHGREIFWQQRRQEKQQQGEAT